MPSYSALKRPFKPVFSVALVVVLVVAGFVRVARQKSQRDLALFRAAGAGDLVGVANLVKQGANPRSYADGEFAPIHIAAMQGHDSVVLALLLYGADVNSPSLRFRKTPLQVAVPRGNVSTVKLLLSRSADPNAQDRFGHTPLSDVLANQRLPSQKRQPDPKFKELERLLRQAGGRP